MFCLEHNKNDSLVASLSGVRHGVLVPVPVSLMQKAGTYYFVLRVWDNHADKYKDHQVKPALEMNQGAQQLPPIVYINDEKWHVAWCLPGRGVTFSTRRANPAEHCVVRDFTDETALNQVRAAINGGFFGPARKRRPNDPKTDRSVQMVAEVGTGKAGNWQPYGRAVLDRPGRWCFGMTATGHISISPMERRIEWDTERGEIRRVFRVHHRIERRFPYGLSNVGLLVQNGQTIAPPDGWRDPHIPRGRTALAWSGRHIFFVTIPDSVGATWNQTADFIRQTLPTILGGQPYNTCIDPLTINAVMLDGGGSTKFGYRLNPRNPSTYSGFPRNHDNNAPNSQRYLTTYITAEATLQE